MLHVIVVSNSAINSGRELLYNFPSPINFSSWLEQVVQIRVTMFRDIGDESNGHTTVSGY